MKHLLITTALVAFAAAPLAAQTATATDPAASTEMMSAPMYMSGNMEVSADKIIGMNVYIQNPDMAADDTMDPAVGIADASDNWDDVGEVGDVLVSAEGEVNSVVIDAGGFLGMGERNVSVTMDQLQFIPDSDNEGDFFIVYTGDKALLEGTDEYDQTAMESQGYMPYTPMSATNAEGTDTMAADGTDTMAADGTAVDGTDTVAADGTDTMVRTDRESLESVDATTITADELKGARVYGVGEEWVGEIGELVLSADGKITDAVVDVGGWLGMGERPVALKFDELDLRRDGDTINVYVDFSEDELKAMPEWQG